MKSKNYLALAAVAGSLAAFGLQSAKADAVLNGNFLRVGVNNTGGLIDSGFVVGIDYDSTGTGTPTGFDFLKPGTPYEFYSIGYAGSPGGYNTFGNFSSNSSSFGYYHGGNYDPLQSTALGSTTVDTSTATVMSASTTGGSYGALAIAQNLSYGINSGFIDFSVTLTNTTGSAITDIVYGRGLDPDQDVYAGGGFPTTNTIVSGDLVTGQAPVTDWTIGIYSNSNYAHTPSVQGGGGGQPIWDSNPYDLQNPHNDGNGDYTISMGWNIGTLEAGESATINFQYRIAETHVAVENVPDSASTLGLIGLAFAGLLGARRRFVRSA